MGNVLMREDIYSSEDGIGYMEQLYEDKSGEKQERVVEPVAWSRNPVGGFDACWPGNGSGLLPDAEEYGIFSKPSDEEYEEYIAQSEDETMLCGIRIWDRKPTESDMENTPWEKKKEA